MIALGYSPAPKDETPNILLGDFAELLTSPEALKGKLISSLAVLATSLLPLRETNPFTADVVTAFCSRCAGTNEHGLSGAGRGPPEAWEESFPSTHGVESRGEGSRA